MSLPDQLHEVADSPEIGQDRHEVRDVVPAIAQWRVVDGQQPDAVDPEPLQVVEPGDQAPQVAGAVTIGVVETADEDLIEDRMLVPPWIARLVEGEGVRHRLVGSRDARQEGDRRRGVSVRRWFRLCHGVSPTNSLLAEGVMTYVTPASSPRLADRRVPQNKAPEPA